MNQLKKEKGQAFSTFQLLIAAVVALALLAVLLPLLKSPNIGNSPTKLTQDLLKSQIDNIGALAYTPTLTIKKDYSLSISGLVDETGIDRSQVAFVLPTELNNSFSNNNLNVLKYLKSTKGTFIIGILCDYEGSDFTTSFDAYTEDISTGNIDEPTFYDTTGGLKVCMIFPKRTS
jgi:hypothetical protein